MPPPSLAKMDIREEPKPSPIRLLRSPVAPKKPLTERSARPATKRPVTEPPAKAVERAFAKPTLAAWAVRTLALTEIFMPIKPEIAEAILPTKKPMAVLRERKNQIAAKIKTATTAITEYCLAR